MLNKKKLVVQKKVDREAKKFQVTAKEFFYQINENLLGDVQKICMYNWLFK